MSFNKSWPEFVSNFPLFFFTSQIHTLYVTFALLNGANAFNITLKPLKPHKIIPLKNQQCTCLIFYFFICFFSNSILSQNQDSGLSGSSDDDRSFLNPNAAAFVPSSSYSAGSGRPQSVPVTSYDNYPDSAFEPTSPSAPTNMDDNCGNGISMPISPTATVRRGGPRGRPRGGKTPSLFSLPSLYQH